MMETYQIILLLTMSVLIITKYLPDDWLIFKKNMESNGKNNYIYILMNPSLPPHLYDAILAQEIYERQMTRKGLNLFRNFSSKWKGELNLIGKEITIQYRIKYGTINNVEAEREYQAGILKNSGVYVGLEDYSVSDIITKMKDNSEYCMNWINSNRGSI